MRPAIRSGVGTPPPMLLKKSMFTPSPAMEGSDVRPADSVPTTGTRPGSAMVTRSLMNPALSKAML